MSSGVVTRKAEVWRKRGNNWRKEGAPLKAGERVTGTTGGEYFYLSSDRRTKKQWIRTDAVVVTPPPVEPPAGDPKTWYFVKHQWLRNDAADYHDRKELPLVFRMGESDNPNNIFSVKLTKELQFFWMDLVAFVLYGKRHGELNKEQYRYAAQKTTSLMTSALAFCNQHGADVCRNYLTGENAEAENPTMYTIVCDGASLGGEEVGRVLKVDHFNPHQLPGDVNPFTDPRVFFATTGGDYHVNRFPQLGGLDVPVPIFCNNDLYFPLVDLEKYESPAKRKPYYP